MCENYKSIVMLNNVLNSKDLQLDYLDLYLIHWPFPFKKDEDRFKGKDKIDTSITLANTWKQMEELVHLGLVKHIGVSNFTIEQVKEICENATIKPFTNQVHNVSFQLIFPKVEVHPFLPQNELKEFCESQGISITAYSPLGSGGKPSLLEYPVIEEISKKNGKTPAQVLISWAVQRGTSLISFLRI